MPNLRLFTGIAIAPNVLEKLDRLLQELRPLAKLKWTPVENLHITTKFIGAWPEERLKELKTALETVQFGKAFEISVTKFGYFPNPRHPHSLFAGIETGPELGELARRIDEALLPLGIPKESRPFTPHLTLARIKNGDVRRVQQHIANMTDSEFTDRAQSTARVAGCALDFGTFTASEFHLYLSKPGPGGSEYTSLAVYA